MNEFNLKVGIYKHFHVFFDNYQITSVLTSAAYMDIESHLEACGPWFSRRYVSVIVDLELRHNGDGRLDDEGDDVRPHLFDVDAFGRQPVQHTGEGALAACVLAVGVHEVAAVHVEGVVGQVHEDVSQVLLAWFL